MRRYLLTCFVLGTISLPGAVSAQEADCSTPQKAVVTWLGNLQEDAPHPEVAIECFDWGGAEISGDARVEYATRLKHVLDARGLWVEVEDLPDENAPNGVSRVHLFQDELPNVYFVRKGGRWVLSAESVRAVPDIYHQTFPFDVDQLLESLPHWFQERVAGISVWQILGILLALLLGMVVRALVAFAVARWGGQLIARREKQKADDTILAKASKPIGTMVMAGILWWFLPLLQLSVRITQIATIGIRILAALSAVMVLYRLVDVLSDVFQRRAAKTETKLDDQLVPLIRKSLKVFVIVLGVIFVLQNMNIDVTSLLAMGTVGTLAVSFAAKDIIANLFGSLSIFAERPFQIGDWVVIGDTEGIVEEVGMRSTRIRTFYNSAITLPNSVITVTPVDNYGARRWRRTSLTLNLTYDTSPEQMEAFCDGVRAILKANEIVRQDYHEVHFKGFGAASLDVMVYFFFETDSWSEELRQRHLVYLEFLRLARDLGVEFAFPTQTLHLASVAEPNAVPPHEVPSNEALGATVIAFAPGGDRSRPEGPRITDGYWPTPAERGSDEAEG